MRPDDELLGIVVHSGLVLGSSKGVVAALRRITAFPAGLTLDAVVVARGVHAEAAARRQHEAMLQRQAEAGARHEHEAAAEQESEAVAQREGEAAARRDRVHMQAMIEHRHLPRFDEGDELRLAVLVHGDQLRWLHPYRSSSSGDEDHYSFEASYWTAPLPVDGMLTLACTWPEVGLGQTVTDVLLPDLAARAAGARSLWELAGET
jgi:hypothetical protein